jgi:hypothetical protein
MTLDEILSVYVANEGGVHARRTDTLAFGNDEGVATSTMVIVIFSRPLSIAWSIAQHSLDRGR